MISKYSVDLLCLLSKTEETTIQSLSKNLKVSKHSVLTYLDELDNYLKSLSEVHVTLVFKNRERVSLLDKYQEMNQVLLHVFNDYSSHQTMLYDGRCIQEILILIGKKDHISLQDLADQIYASKGTIINDLPMIEVILKEYNLQLDRRRNKGVRIIGDELDIRNLFSDIVTGKLDKAPIQFYSYDTINSLYSLFNRAIVDEVNRLIICMIDQNEELSNIQISAILVHVMIAIQRIQVGKELVMPEENRRKIENTSYYEIAKQFVNAIESRFGIHFSSSEIAYIALHLISAKRVLQNYDLAEDDQQGVDEHFRETIDEIVTLISLQTGLNSIEDRELIDGLILHLKPAIERIKNKLSITNPYLDEIKKNYLKSFDIAIQVNEILKEEYGIDYDENEIAYIALHIQAHIERNKVRKLKRIAVVCSSGVGSSQLMLAKLKSCFSEDVELQALSVMEIKDESKQKEFDMIFSMIPLDLNVKVIYVDPFMSKTQLMHLTKSIQNNSISDSERSKLHSVYCLDHIHISNENLTKEEVIHRISQILNKNDFVTDDFEQSVLRREQIASTAYGDYAIPHGDVSTIHQSTIFVWISKLGINWDGKTIHALFLLALNKDQQKNFDSIFQRLYEVVGDSEELQKIISAKTEQEILNILCKG